MGKARFQSFPGSAIAMCLLLYAPAAYSEDARTVIGPANLELSQGAEALMAGDAKEGVRLTLLGIERAHRARERHTAWSNLCAGYAMLDDLDTALDYCDRLIAENDRHWRAYNNRAVVYIKMARYDEAEQDLQKGEEIAPGSRSLKAVRAMLRDAVEPVAPTVIIDDRRQPAEAENDE